MATIKKTRKNSGRKKNTLLIFFAVLIVSGIFVGTATLAKNLYETETYYTLNKDVPADTQITADMLEPHVAAKGSIPFESLLTVGDVQSSESSDAIYSAVRLRAGEMVPYSSIRSGNDDLKKQIPQGWVLTNFSVGADDAVGGRIQRGSYFDIMVATADGGYYPFINVKALDTTVDLSAASSSDAVNTEEAHSGQTTQYTVGLTPENAAKLHSIMAQYGNSVKLVLSNGKSDVASHAGTGSFSGQQPLSVDPDLNGNTQDDKQKSDSNSGQSSTPAGNVSSVPQQSDSDQQSDNQKNDNSK